MPFIRRVRTSQPLDANVGISPDWGGAPLKMLLMQSGGALVDLVNPKTVWTPNNNATKKATPNGMGVTFDGVDDYFSATGYENITGAKGTFFMWAPRIGALDTNGTVWFGTNTGSVAAFQSINNTAYCFGSASFNPGTITSVANSSNTSLVFTANTTINTQRYYRNGVSEGTLDATTPTAFAAGSKSFNFGRYIGGTTWDADADIVIAGFTTDVWTAAQAKAFHDNPWQLLEDELVYVPVSAGGGVTGTSATQDDVDTLTGAASNTVAGTSASTDRADTLAGITAVSVAATSATSDSTDTLSGVASATVTGTSATTDTTDTLTASGTVGNAVSITSATTDTTDTLAAVATVTVAGVAAITEAGDTLAAVTTSTITSASSPTESGDTVAGQVQAFISAQMAAVERGDTLAGAGSTTYPTIGRPTSDTSNTGWLPSTGGVLYAMVDEVVPDPADYVYSTAVGQVCEMALGTTQYPGTASQTLKFRASSSTGNSVIVRLKNTGGATVRTVTQALSVTDTEYDITLTSGEIAAITSGSMSIQLESA